MSVKKRPQVRLKRDVTTTARELCSVYQGLMYAKLHRAAACVRGIPAYDGLSNTHKQHFRKAARDCLDHNAEPKAWIVAQFEKFEEWSRYKRRSKMMLPQPNQLYGLGAITRYIEHAGTQAERERRIPVAKDRQVDKFFREERKLNGLASVMDRLPEEVLERCPEEFTEAFLRHKGVWDIVEEQYHAAME